MSSKKERIRINLKDDQFHLCFSLHDAVLVQPRFEFNTLIFEILEGGKVKRTDAWEDIKNASFLIQKVDPDFTNAVIFESDVRADNPRGWRHPVSAEVMDLYAFIESIGAYASSELTIIDFRVSYCSLGINGVWMYEEQGQAKMCDFSLSIVCDELWIWTE